MDVISNSETALDIVVSKSLNIPNCGKVEPPCSTLELKVTLPSFAIVVDAVPVGLFIAVALISGAVSEPPIVELLVTSNVWPDVIITLFALPPEVWPWIFVTVIWLIYFPYLIPNNFKRPVCCPEPK